MFCKNHGSQNHPEEAQADSGLKSKVGISAVTGSIGAFLAPHLLCVAGGLGLGGASIGGYTFYKHCTEHTAEFSPTEKIALAKLSALPKDPQNFPETKNIKATDILLEQQPIFKEVIEFKRLESEGEPIEVVFMEDSKQDVSVVFCKNGMMCPCTKPEVYEIGSKKDLLNDKERFPGQHQILSVLYAPELK